MKSDSDKVKVEAVVFTKSDKKRLKTLRAEPFERVVNISCHKASLDEFSDGIVVRLKVATAGGQKRGTYIKVARTAFITRVC